MNLSFLSTAPGFSGDVADSVTGVTDNPEMVLPGNIFVCVPSNRVDAKTAVQTALANGAVFAVCQEEYGCENCVVVPDARLMLAKLCNAWYNQAQFSMKLIGITGTNGKTGTAYYIRHILQSLHVKCAVIGTNGCDTGNGETVFTDYTTPPPDILYRLVAQAAENGCEYCIMEVSSQALQQKRVHALPFRLGIFTNLSEEHLDYHKTMENYIAAKAMLGEISERILVNADDAYSERFKASYKGEQIFCYSAKGYYADYMAKNIRNVKNGTEFLLLNQLKLARTVIPAIGEFSVYNALAAGAAVLTEGFDFYEVAKSLQTLGTIPGRAQMLIQGGIRVCIDFAHTPFALSQILQTLQQTKTGRLITVFGCGGERDTEKRPLMGKIAANASDCVVLTNDNPRKENPESILQQIKSGIKSKTDVFVIAEREQAIHFALNKAKPGDTVLIAGKGHETYMEINGEKHPFNDLSCVNRFFGLS